VVVPTIRWNPVSRGRFRSTCGAVCGPGQVPVAMAERTGKRHRFWVSPGAVRVLYPTGAKTGVFRSAGRRGSTGEPWGGTGERGGFRAGRTARRSASRIRMVASSCGLCTNTRFFSGKASGGDAEMTHPLPSRFGPRIRFKRICSVSPFPQRGGGRRPGADAGGAATTEALRTPQGEGSTVPRPRSPFPSGERGAGVAAGRMATSFAGQLEWCVRRRNCPSRGRRCPRPCKPSPAAHMPLPTMPGRRGPSGRSAAGSTGFGCRVVPGGGRVAMNSQRRNRAVVIHGVRRAGLGRRWAGWVWAPAGSAG